MTVLEQIESKKELFAQQLTDEEEESRNGKATFLLVLIPPQTASCRPISWHCVPDEKKMQMAGHAHCSDRQWCTMIGGPSAKIGCAYHDDQGGPFSIT